jgi:hypothetical protein
MVWGCGHGYQKYQQQQQRKLTLILSSSLKRRLPMLSSFCDIREETFTNYRG